MNDPHDNAADDRAALAEYATPASTSLEDEDLINYPDITARIEHLERTGRGCGVAVAPGSCELTDCPRCEDTARQELEALRGLKAGMEQEAGPDMTGRASAIRDSYTEKFIREEYDDLIGDGLNYLEGYIDWDRLTADRAAEMTETTFLGTTYYITS